MIAGIIAFALTSYGVQLLFRTDLEAEIKSAAEEVNQQTEQTAED
ncbi:hypothetical protein [uncultured Pontibacter sp.]|nr:hypothetical protein [uncultured Pontibacter sp.]